TLNNIGAVYQVTGNPAKALAYYERALPVFEEVGDRFGESITRWHIATHYWRDGNLSEAMHEFQRVYDLSIAVQSPYLERIEREMKQVEAELAAQGE
ncbi:MAG TPA: tetratricopeptide repeat protein, partial [Anaerolineales bacterium]|nr:tetratricopeptide repeat protein [Anaerolineales bacterium]